MSLEDRINAATAFDTVTEKNVNPYALAYISFHHDLAVINDINKLIERLFEEMEKKATTRVLSKDLEDELINFGVRLVKTRRTLKKQESKKAYMSVENKGEYEKLFIEEVLRKQGITVIRDLSLVYIVSLFEGYLQKVLQATFDRKPEALKTSKKYYLRGIARRKNHEQS